MKKAILQFTGGMMLAAIAAYLLNPWFWKIIVTYKDDITAYAECFDFFLVGLEYLLVYGLVGAVGRWKWWQSPWGNLAFKIFILINAILAILLLVYLEWPTKEIYHEPLFAVFSLYYSVAAALLSGLPIYLCCYLFKKQAKE